MGTQQKSRAAFANQVQQLVEQIKTGCDCLKIKHRDQLQKAVDAVGHLSNLSQSAEPETGFLQISSRLEKLLQQYVAGRAIFGSLGSELIAITCDRLLHMATLYRKGLVQPQSSLTDLLNTFDIVGSASGPGTLVDLLASKGCSSVVPELDLFADDPLVEVPLSEQVQADPFESDPFLVLETEQLQGTLSDSSGEQLSEKDLFADDPLIEISLSDQVQTDPFESDPCLALDTDQLQGALPDSSGEQLSEVDPFADDPMIFAEEVSIVEKTKSLVDLPVDVFEGDPDVD
jgi:hypothetical protein